MLKGTTLKPSIVKNDNSYVIIGSVDHGMKIPNGSVLELVRSLESTSALMMEAPEESHRYLHLMSTELLVKASVGSSPIHYLSGNRMNEDIGEYVLKYAPQDIAEVYIPCLYVRNCLQVGKRPDLDSIIEFMASYKQRFGFLDVNRALQNYMKLLQYWDQHGLNPEDLDDFSYDFEKFFGDVKEFELWKPELKAFRSKYQGKVAVCVGDYHVPFVRDVLDGKEVRAPDWKHHLEIRREDKLTPQGTDFLKKIYNSIDQALK